MRGSPLRTGRGRLRTPWRLLVFGVVVFVADVVVSIGLLLAGLSVTDPTDTTGGTLAVVLALFVATGVALVVATLAAARYLDRRTTADLGLAADARSWRDLAVGGALGAGLVCGAYLAGVAVGAYRPTVEPTAPATLPFVAWLVLVVLAMLAVGVYEELLVRGYLLTNLAEGFTAVVEERGAVVGALLVTSAGFGLLHGVNPAATTVGIATITLAGLLLGLGYVCTGRLALPIGVHVGWNLAHVLLGLPVSGLAIEVALVRTERSGPAVVHGGSFGPEGGLLGVAATLLGIVAVVGYARRTGRGFRTDVAVPTLRDGTRRSTSPTARSTGDDRGPGRGQDDGGSADDVTADAVSIHGGSDDGTSVVGGTADDERDDGRSDGGRTDRER